MKMPIRSQIENLINVSKHHKEICDTSDCSVSLLTLRITAETLLSQLDPLTLEYMQLKKIIKNNSDNWL